MKNSRNQSTPEKSAFSPNRKLGTPAQAVGNTWTAPKSTKKVLA